MLPAVLIWHHNSSKCCTCSRKEIVEGGTCVERYLTILSWRKKIIAKVLVLVLGGLSCTAAYLASRLEPPREPEEWFSQKHMFQQVADSNFRWRTNAPWSQVVDSKRVLAPVMWRRVGDAEIHVLPPFRSVLRDLFG